VAIELAGRARAAALIEAADRLGTTVSGSSRGGHRTAMPSHQTCERRSRSYELPDRARACVLRSPWQSSLAATLQAAGCGGADDEDRGVGPVVDGGVREPVAKSLVTADAGARVGRDAASTNDPSLFARRSRSRWRVRSGGDRIPCPDEIWAVLKETGGSE